MRMREHPARSVGIYDFTDSFHIGFDFTQKDRPKPFLLAVSFDEELVNVVFGSQTPVHNTSKRNAHKFIFFIQTQRQGVPVSRQVKHITRKLLIIAPVVVPRLIHKNVSE
jgi:hypothetical protein